MSSPYLYRPLRPRSEVMDEILMNALDHYMVVIFDEGRPLFLEQEAGKRFNEIVQELADGQYTFRDGTCPLSVIRISLRDCEAEIVTEKVAQAVAERIGKECVYDEELRDCPFLDEVMPDWRLAARRVA